MVHKIYTHGKGKAYKVRNDNTKDVKVINRNLRFHLAAIVWKQKLKTRHFVVLNTNNPHKHYNVNRMMVDRIKKFTLAIFYIVGTYNMHAHTVYSVHHSLVIAERYLQQKICKYIPLRHYTLHPPHDHLYLL